MNGFAQKMAVSPRGQVLLRYAALVLAFVFVHNVLFAIFYTGNVQHEAAAVVAAAAEPVDNDDVRDWLSTLGLSAHRGVYSERGITTLFQCAAAGDVPRLDDEEEQARLVAGSRELRKRLVLWHWLAQNQWAQLAEPVHDRLRVGSLQALAALVDDGERVKVALSPELAEEVMEAAKYLQPPDSVPQLENLVWSQIQQLSPAASDEEPALATSRKDQAGFYLSPAFLLTAFLAVIIILVVFELRVTPIEVIWGVPLHKSLTRVEWPEDMTSSNTKSVRVTFYNLKGLPLDISEHVDDLSADVSHFSHRNINAFVTQGDKNNVVEVVFTAKQMGRYYVVLKYRSNHIVRGFPTLGYVEPGEADAGHTELVGAKSSTLVLTTCVPETVQIAARDCFGNLVPKNSLPSLASKFRLKLYQRIGDPTTPPLNTKVNFVVYHTAVCDTLCATMGFNAGQEGWHKAAILLDGQPIGNTDLTLLVLTNSEREAVNKVLSGGVDSSSVPSFEANLLAEDGCLLSKAKSVFCCLTAKQLTIKDYFLRIFPRRLYTFRLVPATRITLVRYSDGPERWPVFRLEGSFQSKPEIAVRDGNILAASFHLILLRKLGGSESFRDKQSFFNTRLLAYHASRNSRHTRLPVRVHRDDIIASSFRATRWFAESDWCRLFEIEFEGEPGLDQGGVRREWFEVLCKKMFHPDAGLFASVEEKSEAVYPNPRPPPDVRAKMYKFAGRIVGKCLYESAHGLSYRQHLPARLAKSFLAQLVGLRVHYKHFSDDAPALYNSKIKFIEENPVDDLDLVFSDDEYGPGGELLRTVDLKAGGALKPVDERNKLEYLDLLAQERLCNRVRQQTEQFLQGIYLFIPESLLSLFDESELELLLCGVREYNLFELKKNHTIVSHSFSFSTTLKWFWAVLDGFSAEQFAKLLQFTTGSSQLPPGGFAELSPQFQISAAMGTRRMLPTAHTCFNMICLPEHDSFKEFEQALLTAINEGNEGFGLA